MIVVYFYVLFSSYEFIVEQQLSLLQDCQSALNYLFDIFIHFISYSQPLCSRTVRGDGDIYHLGKYHAFY